MTQTTGHGAQPLGLSPMLRRNPKRVHWLGATALCGLCFLVGVSCGAVATRQQSPTAPTIAAPANTTVAAAPAVVAAAGGISNGIYAIGDEVAPGEYRSPGAVSTRTSCYVAVIQGSQFLAQEVVPEGQARIKIDKTWLGAQLKVSGCRPFARVG